jgi:hypothetical protein
MIEVNYKRTKEFFSAVEHEGLSYAIIHYDDFSDVGGDLGEKIIEFEKLYKEIEFLIDE